MNIDAKTQLCGLLGNPVDHSLSPAIHNAAFEHLGLNFVYLAFPVEDIEGAMRGIKALGNLRGFSVTIPHKVAVMPYLEDIELTARHIGSVNTIVKENGKLTGYNTDASGALLALQQAGVSLSQKKVLMLGSGGAARAIAFAIAGGEAVQSFTILGIDEKERTRLVEELREKTSIDVKQGNISDATLGENLPGTHVLIHCTPVGMYPKTNESCVPQHLLTSGLTIMDIVYNPMETRLLREGREKGCKVIAGIEMFVNQAVGQFERWTGHPAPLKVMRAVLEARFQ